MGFLARLDPRSWAPQNATLSNPDDWLVEAILGGLHTAAGVTVTPLKAIGVATVLACANRVSGSMSSAPLEIRKSLPDGGSEPATEHPLYEMLHDQPNPEMSGVDFVGAVQLSATLRQNAYALIVRNGMDEIAELWPIEPHEMQVLRDPVTRDMRYILNGRQVPARSVLHIRGLSANGVIGLDTVTVARECIALAIALQDNAARFFSNGSRPGVILEHPARLSREAAINLRESFDSLFAGNRNAYKTVVAEEGMKVALQRQDNRSSQFQEARLAIAKEICQIFGVPPHKVGILDEANFSTIEQQNIEYVTDTIFPWARRWQAAGKLKLLNPAERGTYFLQFDLTALERGSKLDRYNSYALGRTGGWLCADEIREREGMNPIPGGAGKTFMEPMNMQALGESSEDDENEGGDNSAGNRGGKGKKPPKVLTQGGDDNEN